MDCGPRDRGALQSSAPTVVVEVLSPSTRGIDLVRKTEEYRTLATLRHIMLIEPDQVRVAGWSRAGDGAPWDLMEHDEFGSEAELAAIGVRLALSAIYDGVEPAAEQA